MKKKWLDDESKIKNKNLLFFMIGGVFLVLLCLTLIFYNVGYKDGVDKTNEISKKIMQEENEKSMMKMELEDVEDIFLKHLMIKCMAWLPTLLAIIFVLCFFYIIAR